VITPEDEYDDYKTKLDTICPKGHNYITSYDNFKNRNRNCRHCHYEKISNDFKCPLGKARDIADNARLNLLTDNFKNMKVNVEFQCIDCNYIFPTTLDSIKWKKTGCPKCRSSEGERLIMERLEDWKRIKLILDYKKEYKFPKGECDMIRPLPYDYHVKINKNIEFLIEFDGIQHFDETIEFKKGNNNFEHTRKSDIIKTKYCMDHNIPLLRIAYIDVDKIYDILTDFSVYLQNYWIKNKCLPDETVKYSNKQLYNDLINVL
jgi:hypothetical protein